MAVLLCPLCSQPRFNNLESLRVCLIKAATQNIFCPICNEILTGLDKFTIHLFGHTLSLSSEKPQCIELKISNSESNINECLDPRVPTCSAKEVTSEINLITGFSQCGKAQNIRTEDDLKEKESMKNSETYVINANDFDGITSWENLLHIQNNANESNIKSRDFLVPTGNSKEGSTELSEYMSDLLNKKLPILNFDYSAQCTESLKENELFSETDTEKSKCSTCDLSFENYNLLSMHQELVHSEAKAVEEKLESEKPNAEFPLNEEFLKNLVLPRYECHLCSKSFKMKGSLLVHYRVVHLGLSTSDSLQTSAIPNIKDSINFQCSICNKCFKKEQHLTQHIKTHEGKQWRCETCNKHFTTKYFLKKHQRLHTGEMPYSCQSCNKTFTFQQSYHKHLLYHSDEKPHKCTQCGRAFKELSTLHNHQRIHSGEKPFACETCGKCFRQRVSYIVHQRIHTGALPYQCTACKKKFRYKVSQRSHKCLAQPLGIVVRQTFQE